MKKYLTLLFLLSLLAPATSGLSQKLKPGFVAAEYIELLHLYSRQGSRDFYGDISESSKYRRVYRSPVLGLDNRWDLNVSADSVAVISIRGTTRSTDSWLENFYAAMVPATGSLQLSKEKTFSYKLAQDPNAAVHAGWLLATAYLAPDILAKIDSSYHTGIRDFIILGHSQGGAIGYLLTSHVRQLQQEGALPADIRFKTYSSAAPKPGNLYYAYAYEASTANGWAYNVVNSADWVPETPVSIQTVQDFNPNNPFSNAREMIKKQKFPKSLAFRYLFGKLDNPTRRAQRKYQRYLGSAASRFVRKSLPDFTPPVYAPSSNYVRTGNQVVLLADEEYYQKFPEEKANVFTHHKLQPYLFLARKLEPPKEEPSQVRNRP